MIGNPIAFAHMGKGTVHKERGRIRRRGRRAASWRCEAAAEARDPETESWIVGMQAMLRTVQGDPEAGISIARRGYEIAEQLGDVFSRSLALSNLGWAQLEAGEFETALESIEEADRLYSGGDGDRRRDGGLAPLPAGGSAARPRARSRRPWRSAERAVEASVPARDSLGRLPGALLARPREGGGWRSAGSRARLTDEALSMAKENRAVVFAERVEADLQALGAGSR